MHCQYLGKELTSSFALTMSGQRKACHLMQPEARLAELCSAAGSGGRGYIKRGGSGRLTQDGISQLLTALLSLLHDDNQSHYWFHVHAGGGGGGGLIEVQ